MVEDLGARPIVSNVREGDILAGKYRIERILGRGGMGVVVAADHIQLDEKVAIKFLLPESLGSADIVARFVREARAAVKIKSEHVARVIDVGTLDNGAPYMVMEYLQGEDLATWLHRRGRLPIDQAVEFILQAGEAIAEAHRLGIVHRDLKPANLFCTLGADELLSVKVLDFGISKMKGPGSSGAELDMTRTAAVMGSPYYMSPEQMHCARDVDGRTDVWALGIIFYELLAGTRPFEGTSLPDLCIRIATWPPAPLRAARPDLPEGLEPVILRCLEKNREARYANLAQFALALTPFASTRALGSIDRITRIVRASSPLIHSVGQPVSPPSARVASMPGSSMAPPSVPLQPAPFPPLAAAPPPTPLLSGPLQPASPVAAGPLPLPTAAGSNPQSPGPATAGRDHSTPSTLNEWGRTVGQKAPRRRTLVWACGGVLLIGGTTALIVVRPWSVSASANTAHSSSSLSMRASPVDIARPATDHGSLAVIPNKPVVSEPTERAAMPSASSALSGSGASIASTSILPARTPERPATAAPMRVGGTAIRPTTPTSGLARSAPEPAPAASEGQAAPGGTAIGSPKKNAFDVHLK